MTEGPPGEKIGRNIRVVREAQLLSRTDLAERSGISKAGIDHLERGLSARPRRRTIEKIAEALDVPVGDLLSEEPIRPKASAPPSQLSLNGLLQEERRGLISEALTAYMRQRAEERDRQARDPDSPHFRTAAGAKAWVADVREEMRTWSGWLFSHAPILLPPAEEASQEEYWHAIQDFAVQVVMGGFGPALIQAGERIRVLESTPDDLEFQRIARDAIAEVEAEMEAEASRHRREATGESA